jgi:hypothetical protein
LRFRVPARPEPVDLRTYCATKAADTKTTPESLLPLHAWWINGGIACNVMPDNIWGAYHITELLEMLNAAAPSVPDCTFFINKRDYPQLRATVGAEPYERFLGTRDLCRERYHAYAPVLSFYGGADFADVIMPLTEDWKLEPAVAAPQHWSKAAAVAIWRGTATGNGLDARTNVRLRLVEFADAHADIIDAKLTGYNLRDKMSADPDGTVRVSYLDVARAPTRAPYVTLAEQLAAHKYVVYVDGHCAANRYGALMHGGRAILKVASERLADGGQQWLFPDLVGHCVSESTWEALPDASVDHFIIESTLSNLRATVLWLREHDDVAQRVAACALSKAPTRAACVNAWIHTLHAVASAQHTAAPPLAGAKKAWYSPYDSRYAKLGRPHVGDCFTAT